jgi:ribonuclease BN (tRNA processing enzyme)
MARIIFLGTSGSMAVTSKGIRKSGGIVIQENDLQLLLDPGPGTLQAARDCGIQLHHTHAVLVTHNHLNHCNDLNVVIDSMTHSGIERRGVILAAKSVIHSQEHSIPIITKYHKNLVERIIPMEKNHKVGIELVEINALPAEHSDPTAVGFKVHCPKFTVSYSGDTKLTDALLQSLMGSDFLILNVPYPRGRESDHNLNSDDAIKIISQVRPRLAIITHFGLEMIRADPIQEARDIQRITGVQTISAKDGLAITPTGYGEYKSPIKGYDD